MQFIDLAAQQARIKSQIDARIQTVLAHDNYIMGPEVKELEEKLAAYAGTKHAIGCASGTDALLLALMAYGVGPGDAIFTTPFTFIATAEVISLLGATPIFVDIGAEYKGRKACSLADIACTSFFPAKPLGCYGDGGIPIASSASPCIRI